MSKGTIEEERRESELNEDISVVPVKLTNSQVLQNLDHELAHIESYKKKQMSELIHTSRDVFPDVPRRTNVMFHDGDVGNVTPMKHHPYCVKPEKY